MPSWTAAVLGGILVAAVLSITADNFLSTRNLTNVLAQTAVLAVLATGQTFVMMTAGIDLSVAAVAALSGTTFGFLTVTHEANAVVALVVVVVVGIVVGVIQGATVAKLKLPAFIVTLGGLLVWRGLALELVGGINTTGLPDLAVWLGQGKILGIPVPGLVAILVVVLSALVLRKTRFGVGLHAIGGDETAAARAGVPVSRYRIAAYAISGFLAALGGVILVGRLDSAGGSLGMGLELQVIAAAAIGGVSLFGGSGTPWGAFFGAILIGFIQNGMNLLGVSAFVQMMASGLILVLAVGVDQARKALMRSQ